MKLTYDDFITIELCIDQSIKNNTSHGMRVQLEELKKKVQHVSRFPNVLYSDGDIKITYSIRETFVITALIHNVLIDADFTKAETLSYINIALPKEKELLEKVRSL